MWRFSRCSVQTYSSVFFCLPCIYLCISSGLCCGASDKRSFHSSKLQFWFAVWIQQEYIVYYCDRWKPWKWAKFKQFSIASDQQILWREFACCEYLILTSSNYLVCWQCYCVNLWWLSRVSVLHSCQFLLVFIGFTIRALLCVLGKLPNAVQWSCPFTPTQHWGYPSFKEQHKQNGRCYNLPPSTIMEVQSLCLQSCMHYLQLVVLCSDTEGSKKLITLAFPVLISKWHCMKCWPHRDCQDSA